MINRNSLIRPDIVKENSNMNFSQQNQLLIYKVWLENLWFGNLSYRFYPIVTEVQHKRVCEKSV